MAETVLQRKIDAILDSVALLERYMKAFDKGKALPGQVQAWAEKLEKLNDNFYQAAIELEALPGGKGEAAVSGKTDRQSFDARYYVLRAFYITNLSAPAPAQVPQQQFRCVKLPELVLPKFSGNLEDWCAFRDSFESAVGSRTDIGPIEKLQYLRGCVQGEAARLLEPIKTSDRGYKDAWRTLRLRYEDKRQLIKCHIRVLLEVPPMKRESAEELLGVVDRFEQQISVLKSLGEPADKWSSLLVYHLSTRLDPRTLRIWESHCAKMDSENVAAVLGGIAAEESAEAEGMPSYLSMVNFLQNHARVLHAAPPDPVREPVSPRDRKPKFWKSGSYAATGSPSSQSSCSSVTTSRKCFMRCSTPHFLYHCPRFHKLEFNEKLSVARENRLCLNCLRSSAHYARDCPGQHCHRCSQKHHTVLHITRSSQSSTPSPNRGESASGASTASSSVVSSPQIACVATSSEDTTSEIVLLPTALVNIRDSEGKVVSARCLLDSASQRNFISQRLCDHLKLDCVRLPVPAHVCGIGGSTTTYTHHVAVSLSSRDSSFALETTALIEPTITVRLPQTHFDSRKWPIPDHVDLADPAFHVPGDVDIVLGSAHFLSLLRVGSVTIGDQLPMLQRTVFGWVVAGPYTLARRDQSGPRACFISCESNRGSSAANRVAERRKGSGCHQPSSTARRWIDSSRRPASPRSRSRGRAPHRLPKRPRLIETIVRKSTLQYTPVAAFNRSPENLVSWRPATWARRHQLERSSAGFEALLAVNGGRSCNIQPHPHHPGSGHRSASNRDAEVVVPSINCRARHGVWP